MVEPRRNIELKATDLAPQRAIEACRALNAEDRGTIWQRDSGLKLREEDPGLAHLVQFERADEA